ncbi:hypothetical protein ACFL01_04175 [Planctomycetota bacterium]
MSRVYSICAVAMVCVCAACLPAEAAGKTVPGVLDDISTVNRKMLREGTLFKGG